MLLSLLLQGSLKPLKDVVAAVVSEPRWYCRAVEAVGRGGFQTVTGEEGSCPLGAVNAAAV